MAETVGPTLAQATTKELLEELYLRADKWSPGLGVLRPLVRHQVATMLLRIPKEQLAGTRPEDMSLEEGRPK